MKHLKGETLATIIERLQAGDPEAHRRFTFTVRQQIFLGVLNAVAYAHGQGVIHRDLKPANIMVGPFGEVTVMDWGLARRTGASEFPLPAGQPIPLRQEAGKSAGREIFRTQAGVVMGTPLYMSPEQARGAHDEVDERTDTYALTVILHELMSLYHYLDDTQPVEQILKDVQTVKPRVVSTKKHPTQPVLPAEIAWFVDKGLEKDRTRRYQNVQEMIETLQRGLGAHVAVQCHRTLIKRVLQEVATRADAHPIAVMVGGATVMGLFVAAVVKSLLVLGGN
jgi:serine/threonine-protein kinase